MMTAPDSMANAKYGPLSRKVGKPMMSANTTAASMPTGKLHQALAPNSVLRKPAA